MKTPFHSLSRIVSTLAVSAAALLLGLNPASATNYAGNGDTSFGGDIGKGTLSLTDDGTNIYGSLTCGNSGNMYNTLVIYIDTGVGGGFTTTTNFNDQNDALRVGISGVQNGQGRSVMSFANGFAPQFAIALGPNTASFGGLWQLETGGNNSLNYITSANLTPNTGHAGPFTFSIPASGIGLTTGTPATIKIFGTYISGSGYRSSEAIAGNDFSTFGAGWNPYTNTAYATYSFAAPPAQTYPVTFAVDMTAQIANGAFHPLNGDTVYVGGTFLTNISSNFQLTPSVANTNIYTGTYADANPTNTPELYKFSYNTAGSPTNYFETLDSRPFTLQAPGVTNTLVYFDDVFAIPSVTTNDLTFSIDMGPQISLGHFNPGNGDTIQVLGTFENPKWTVGFILTNNPGGGTPNVYSGSIGDGNYPGSFENYKFVIVSGGVSTYESINNRDFFTPTGSYTFPLAYFNNVTTVYATPITFQVDMTAPLAAGTFVPANGDTVTAAGTFQTNQWTPGVFVLTNNPTGANSNVFSGTYVDRNTPGTGEQYKFTINPGGNGSAANYESVNNRTFLLGSTAQTLPVVFWNNADPNNVLLVPTTVTFTVSMTNAVDVFGNPFNPANDLVMVDGTFENPNWQVMNHATDPLVSSDYPNNVMQNNPPGSGLYTATFSVPPGTSLSIDYKYGIFHNSSALNTNVDNEAAFGDNHERYIRALGNYNFPVDIFGIQRTNPGAATEPSFGNLAIGPAANGQLPITWLGRPGVLLQYSTNLVSGAWLNVNSTDGTNSYGWPQTTGAEFFRLVNP
jgi:hypothetical protein